MAEAIDGLIYVTHREHTAVTIPGSVLDQFDQSLLEVIRVLVFVDKDRSEREPHRRRRRNQVNRFLL